MQRLRAARRLILCAAAVGACSVTHLSARANPLERFPGSSIRSTGPGAVGFFLPGDGWPSGRLTYSPSFRGGYATNITVNTAVQRGGVAGALYTAMLRDTGYVPIVDTYVGTNAAVFEEAFGALPEGHPFRTLVATEAVPSVRAFARHNYAVAASMFTSVPQGGYIGEATLVRVAHSAGVSQLNRIRRLAYISVATNVAIPQLFANAFYPGEIGGGVAHFVESAPLEQLARPYMPTEPFSSAAPPARLASFVGPGDAAAWAARLSAVDRPLTRAASFTKRDVDLLRAVAENRRGAKLSDLKYTSTLAARQDVAAARALGLSRDMRWLWLRRLIPR